MLLYLDSAALVNGALFVCFMFFFFLRTENKRALDS